MPLTPHRRHLKSCEHAAKGWNFTLCDCPVWCDGMLNGRRVMRSLHTSNWERALRRMGLIESGGDAFAEVTAAGPTLEKATEGFLADAEARKLKPSTIASYRRTLAHLRKHFTDKRPIVTIDLPALTEFRKGREVKARTARKELEHLRAFFGWCHDRKWTADNPAKKLRSPLVEGIATLPFSDDEIQGLIAACSEISSDDPGETLYVRHRALALVYVLLYSGLRISDVAQLRRSALDAKTGHLTLRIEKTGVPLKVQIHSPEARRALSTLPASNPAYFFWTGNGDVITCVKNLRRTISRLGAIAKVHAHPHRFRDTFAVELLTLGTDIRTVQKLLGHESVLTTEKHYANFVAAHQKLLDSATARLDFSPKAARPLLMHPRKNRRRNA